MIFNILIKNILLFQKFEKSSNKVVL